VKEAELDIKNMSEDIIRNRKVRRKAP